jgi:hypothetical protein
MLMSASESWAREKNVPCGHLHVHVLNSTYEITCRDGSTVRLIENGHLTALDDPKVIGIATKYVDLKEVLKGDPGGVRSVYYGAGSLLERLCARSHGAAQEARQGEVPGGCLKKRTGRELPRKGA